MSEFSAKKFAPHQFSGIALAAILGCLIPAGPIAAADDRKEGRPEPNIVGIELGPGIINAVQERKLINDWSQREIDAYYEVLDLARKTPYDQQVKRASENFDRELEHFREETEAEYQKRLKEIDEKAAEWGKIEETRQRSFASQRRNRTLKLIDGFKDDPSEFPLFVRVTNSLIRDKEKSRFAGKLITLRGYVRKLISYPANDNKFGVKTLYEAWVYTEDSAKNPAVVICTEIPEGMPTGERIVEDVTVTGYVFRLHAYHSDMRNADGKPGKIHLAPMLMAAKIEWHPRQPPTKVPTWIIGGGIAILLLIAVVVVLLGRRDKSEHRRQIDHSLAGGEAPRIDLPSDES